MNSFGYNSSFIKGGTLWLFLETNIFPSLFIYQRRYFSLISNQVLKRAKPRWTVADQWESWTDDCRCIMNCVIIYTAVLSILIMYTYENESLFINHRIKKACRLDAFIEKKNICFVTNVWKKYCSKMPKHLSFSLKRRYLKKWAKKKKWKREVITWKLEFREESGKIIRENERERERERES